MRQTAPKLAALMITGSLACAAPAHAADDVVIVYDASGSMWGQVDGTSKIEIARDVLADLVNDWGTDTNLGLVAYGHRSQGDCTDIETLIPPGPVEKAGFIKMVNAIRPVGKTPISAAVQHAADLLSYRDNPATVILISDGVETCNADPCALSAQLARQGVKFTAHVVGFDLKDGENASLSCIAENTGGMFVPAGNAAELHDALAQVQNAIDLQPIAPEPVPETVLPEVGLAGPETVTTGAMFDVTWSGNIHPQDYITIVPLGAKEGESGAYIRVKDNTEGSLTAPAEVGLYELRYVLNEGSRTLAAAQIEVVGAEVTLSAPSVVRAGAPVAIGWSQTINPNDYVTIVPTGEPEGSYGVYFRARSASQGELTAPKEPGLYEIRYVLNEGQMTLAMASLEVVGADAPLDEGAGLSVPETAARGGTITVSWTGESDSTDQRIAVARKDQPDFSWITVQKVGAERTMDLTMPDEPGLYEVRFLDVAGRALLGRSVIEVK